MANPALKQAPDISPEKPQQAGPAAVDQKKPSFWQRNRRPLLLVALPAVGLIVGFTLYLRGGRYAETDDAYVGAQKVMITPDISGNVTKVVVVEGQQVKAGDVLLQIDPDPFQYTLDQAKAQLLLAQTNYDNLVNNIRSYRDMQTLSEQGVALKQRDVDRKSALAKNNFGSQLDLDNSISALVLSRSQLDYLKQQLATARNQLLGNDDLPLEKFPPWLQAKSAVDTAQRNLDHTVVRAPINGVATQVDNIQLGRYAVAGSPIFSLIDLSKPWVDANLKESDFTYVQVGQEVAMDIDAFPGHTFKGKVGSLSPGTGAQFAILPPQNSTGNFVKVVQRVPVRIYFDNSDPYVGKIKAGMSTYVMIDTQHKRTLGGLLGFGKANAHPN